jgi:hypothetical protein
MGATVVVSLLASESEADESGSEADEPGSEVEDGSSRDSAIVLGRRRRLSPPAAVARARRREIEARTAADRARQRVIDAHGEGAYLPNPRLSQEAGRRGPSSAD